GSTPVARQIERELAGRLTRTGGPVPLIAETGGLNAMVVDSSALPEQVAADVIASAFDWAGQRCSALRILCHAVTQVRLGETAARGTFVAPTLIEVEKIADVEREVFGPVLHVLRYKRAELDGLIDAINAAGYGLTFG